MNIFISIQRAVPVLAVAVAAGTLGGCANMEVNTGRGNIPGYYIRTEMQEADRAVEAARAAGKDKQCPAEFKDAEAAKDKAYDVFRACFTEEGAALAKQATAKVNALCPAAPPAPAPKAPEPPPVPKVVPPAPAPAPPAAPTAAITVVPATVVKGQTATLSWKSQNATGCTILPGIGSVPPQGARVITPAADTAYNLSCSGAGGTATSATAVAVTVPPPPKPVVTAAAERFCSKPAVINIQFDTDKSFVKPQYDAELKTLADFLKEFPKAKGEISGHTDNVGSKAYNNKLSQSRAESVKKYIVEKFGISADRISAKGYDFSKPVADNKTKEGKARNRRIEANFTCE